MNRCLLALTLLLPALSACDPKGAGPEDRLANEDLDLQGEACDAGASEGSPAYRLCASGQGVQTCSDYDWEIEQSVWAFCDMGDGCTAGDTFKTEVYEDDPCSGQTVTCVDYEGVTRWESPECNTPLVFSFDQAPVEYASYVGDPHAASFSVGDNSCTATDWPKATTPWLARDLDGDGQIQSGAELFGSGTRLASGRRAVHGFEALGELDENHDGRIDDKDPAFGELVVWADHDGDRRSGPGELSSLADHGVRSMSLDYQVSPQCDARGNCGRERALFEFAAGAQSQSGALIDVYLPCR